VGKWLAGYVDEQGHIVSQGEIIDFFNNDWRHRFRVRFLE